MIESPPPDALHLINRVVEMRQADAPTLAKLLGGRAQTDPQASNPYYHVWQVVGSDRVLTAELRLPKGPDSPRVIVIDFDNRHGCTSRTDLVSRYGQPPELSVPTPRQPPDSPTYYIYRQKWGDIRVGIDDRDCIASVVVDVER